MVRPMMVGVDYLPRGTVTLLFSDIEGSTRLLARVGGEAYARLLETHRHILRTAWSDHAGRELGTEGDGFFVVFETALQAVGAAVQAQVGLAGDLWPDGEVRVRMGIHTGTPSAHGDGYVGMDVHRAARIANAAHGGQVVLSSTTAALLPEQLPAGVTLRDLGYHRLKDLPAAEQLYQVCISGQPDAFPPLKSVGSATRLPMFGTPLVGRNGEVAKLVATVGVADVHLVTLTGPGGSGKSRLAAAVAAEISHAAHEGVFFMTFAAETDHDAAWRIIGAAVGVPLERRSRDGVVQELGARRTVLVLDNLDQVLDAGTLVTELLEGAPQATVIATSRHPLHVSAEHQHPVRPLGLPDSNALASVQASPAVALFELNARKVQPEFRVTGQNAADVATICAALDGLPLALELAAARIKVLTPAALRRRLDKVLDIAASSSAMSSRHQSLRATIAWSYALLRPPLQNALRRFGVFSGGADLDAVSAIVLPESQVDTLELVAELVDVSLLDLTEGDDGEPRVALLDTTRAFALEALEQNGELDDVRNLHAQHYLSVVRTLAGWLDDERYLDARDRYTREEGNLHDALAWALPAEAGGVGRGRADLGLQLCAAIAMFWEYGGYYSGTGSIWVQRALARSTQVESPERGHCLRYRAACLAAEGNLEAARDILRQNLILARQLDNPRDLCRALDRIAYVEWQRGDLEAARSHYQEALPLARLAQDQLQLHANLIHYAMLVGTEGNHETALGLHREALEVALQLDNRILVATDRGNVADQLRLMGRIHEAHTLIRELIPEELDLGIPASLITAAEDYAAILAEDGDPESAAALMGGADAARERGNFTRPPQQQAEIQSAINAAMEALPPDEWERAYLRGHRTPLADLLAAVRSADESTRPDSGAP